MAKCSSAADAVLDLVQTDVELSEIFMRAFILRRAMLLERGFSDVIVLRSAYDARTLQIREFLSGNSHPARTWTSIATRHRREVLDWTLHGR
jgi:thioredoxin reductase (NADPH)